MSHLNDNIYIVLTKQDQATMNKPIFQIPHPCIMCGNDVKKDFVELEHANYIDKQCLTTIQQNIADSQVDQEMLPFYNYILQLIVKCHRCLNIIDGTIRKRVSQHNASPVCNLCVPIKKEGQKPPQFCTLCNKQFNQKVFKDMSIEVSGLKICQKCYGYQLKGMEETKEKQEKPDFGDLAMGNLYKEEKQQPKKQLIKEAPVIRHELKWYTNNQEKKEKVPYTFAQHMKKDVVRMNEPMKHSNSLKSFSFRPEEKPKPAEEFQFPIEALFDENVPKKAENRSCPNCYRVFQKGSQKNRVLNSDLCVSCHNASVKFGMKKEEKKDEDDAWQLYDLFNETPQIKPEIKVEAQKPYKKEETIPDIVVDLDNINYDLKGCKICFNGKATMINNNCRHLMMCDTCYRQLHNRQKMRNDTMPCPYCASVGRYTRYIEPIYI